MDVIYLYIEKNEERKKIKKKKIKAQISLGYE